LPDYTFVDAYTGRQVVVIEMALATAIVDIYTEIDRFLSKYAHGMPFGKASVSQCLLPVTIITEK
jgi:hypothetical protein